MLVFVHLNGMIVKRVSNCVPCGKVFQVASRESAEILDPNRPKSILLPSEAETKSFSG